MSKKSKDENKKAKKERHPVRNTLIVAVLLSALFGGGYGAGKMGLIDLGSLGIESNKETTAAETEKDTTADVTTTAEVTTEVVSEEQKKVVIEVCENDIFVGDKTFAKDSELKDYILSVYEEGMELELVDNKAVKSAYDSVKAVLDELNYKYAESVKSAK